MCFSSRRCLRCIGGATESIGSVMIHNAVNGGEVEDEGPEGVRHGQMVVAETSPERLLACAHERTSSSKLRYAFVQSLTSLKKDIHQSQRFSHQQITQLPSLRLQQQRSVCRQDNANDERHQHHHQHALQLNLCRIKFRQLISQLVAQLVRLWTKRCRRSPRTDHLRNGLDVLPRASFDTFGHAG